MHYISFVNFLKHTIVLLKNVFIDVFIRSIIDIYLMTRWVQACMKQVSFYSEKNYSYKTKTIIIQFLILTNLVQNEYNSLNFIGIGLLSCIQIDCVTRCTSKFANYNQRIAMNFAEIQAKKMIDMQEQAEAQVQAPTVNNQTNDNTKPS